MREDLTRRNNIEIRGREYFIQLLKSDAISEVGENVRRGSIGENEWVVKKVMRD